MQGAPEMIALLCRQDTVPADFQSQVDQYSQHGYRLIAVASRQLELSYAKAMKVKRESIEHDLHMLGLIVMENRLKPQTVGVINQVIALVYMPRQKSPKSFVSAEQSEHKDCHDHGGQFADGAECGEGVRDHQAEQESVPAGGESGAEVQGWEEPSGAEAGCVFVGGCCKL